MSQNKTKNTKLNTDRVKFSCTLQPKGKTLKKIFLIFTFISGYVLGSKAGKERYNQIKKYSKKIRQTPIVDKTVTKVTDKTEEFVKKQGEKITDKVAEIVKENLFATKPVKIVTTQEPTPPQQANETATSSKTSQTTQNKNSYETINPTRLPDNN